MDAANSNMMGLAGTRSSGQHFPLKTVIHRREISAAIFVVAVVVAIEIFVGQVQRIGITRVFNYTRNHYVQAGYLLKPGAPDWLSDDYTRSSS